MAISAMLPAIMTVAQGVMEYQAKGSAANAMVRQAQLKQQGFNFEADQQDKNAGQQEAASQRTAAEKERIGGLGLSRVQYLAAAQGGGIDATVMRLQADILARTGYETALALYQGQEAAEGMRFDAETKRWMGKATVRDAQAGKKASRFSQVAGLAKTGAKVYEQTSLFGQETKTAPSMAQKYNGDPIADLRTPPDQMGWE